ncbi:HAD hydrolase-like protein [Thalassospiraceae bacterium LMO-JJ14]|nr:HAD hydrolase-like protein [Thalassospiraceae bacterium LMO-JJ14]
MNTQRGLFLDLDGTLAASLGVMRGVYDRFLASHGCIGTTDEFDSLNGPPLNEIILRLHAAHGLDEDPAKLERQYKGFVIEAYDEVEPAPDAGRLLEHAHKTAWRCAVVTSNDETLARRWLARHCLETMCDAVVGDTAGRPGKPSGAPYLAALALTDTQPDISLAVEDSAQGATSALAAGIPTLMLTCYGGECLPGTQPVESLSDVLKRIAND